MLDFCMHVLQGKGEFTMEYMEHNTVSQDVQMQLVNAYKATVNGE
jgi:elongation factor G